MGAGAFSLASSLRKPSLAPPGGAGFHFGEAAFGLASSGSGVASHILTVPSSEALARRLPSGLKHTLRTLPVCPLRDSASWPVCASHTWTVRPARALARRLPSG